MSQPIDLVASAVPREFDAFLRTPMRVVQLVSAFVWTLPLLWFQLWWWLPLPLAASFILYEYFFYARGDRPIALRFTGQQLTIQDALLEKETTYDLSTVHSAVLMHRRMDGATLEAVLALSTVDGPLLTLQFRMPPNQYTPHPRAVDGDLANGFLGAIAGVVRALAPRDVILRQVIDDPRPLAWLYLHLPAEAWQRVTVRVWQGAEPELDLFGYYSDMHDGLLTLDERGATWSFESGSATAPIGAFDVASSMRTAVFFQMDGGEHSENAEELPLMLQAIGGRTLAIPAPLSAEIAPVPPHSDLLHVHAPEGAVILWWLWSSIPQENWPDAWTEGLREARVTVESWPSALPPVHRRDGPDAAV